MNAVFDRDDFVGASTTLRSACERALAASACVSPVYIWGAAGVGKETFANAIAKREVVKLRCDRISAQRWNALTSEENGEDVLDALAPNGERVYFTEIETLPKSTQRRLASRVRDWSSRVIFSSTRSYRECRDEGIWEPEFESLLTAFPICLPALSDRRDDLPALARLFLRQEANKLGEWKRELSDRELDAIMKLETPNNLDDLRTIAAKLASGDREPFTLNKPQVEERDEPERAPRKPLSKATIENGLDAIELTPENFPSLEEAAIRHIEAALKLTNGVVEGKTGAAELLKINPYTLRSRMRKMKVDWTKFREE